MLRPRADADVVLALTSVRRSYGRGPGTVTALDNVTTSFARGSFTAVMGPSGSGKSTLLHCAAGLDRPDAGEIFLDGQAIHDLDERRLAAVRRRRIGFIFQAYNLLPALTARQNITLPGELNGERIDRRHVDEVIAAVGMTERADHRPAQLSGGQQQRVAIARAMFTRPAVIFADEPTGALDSQSAADVLRLLREAVDRHGRTVIMVTHDPSAAAYADRAVFLRDGKLAGSLANPSVDRITGSTQQIDAVHGGGSNVAR
ncbi:ABC transporter ATP-binding protein [Dactylosporangium sp. NPDC000555]|uniref:ABC transporter ATP-binding protein n=1 Tax=Dactylosporangium sp. NPDC000555 TaxID=3154260 RepID=UPI0033259F4F